MAAQYIMAGKQQYALLVKEYKHHQKWMVDLFSPKGLGIILAKQKAIG